MSRLSRPDRPTAILANPSADAEKVMGVFARGMAPLAPLGLAYVAGALRDLGWRVRVLDLYADRGLDLASEVRDLKPEFVGFSCLTPTMPSVFGEIRRIRAISPRTKIVLGNIHADVFARELLEDRWADFCVRGEGEPGLANVARVIQGEISPEEARGVVSLEKGEIVDGGRNDPIPDLDANARPAWELFNLARYKAPPWLSLADAIVPLQASRGCPYTCNFCSQNYMQGRLRIRSNDAVLDEIAWMADSLGVRYVGFADAIFPLTRAQGFDFCKKMVERGLHKRVRWLTETRVDLVDAEILEAMHEAGCRTILYGFEVGNQEILSATGKGALIEQARSAMRWTRRARIRTLGLFMLGLPGETLETCRETIRFACELSPDFAKFNRAVPLPGSPLFDEMRQTLPLKEAYERFSSWHPSDGSDLLFVPDGMTGAELVRVQREAVRRFYLRPRAVWQHLASGTVGPRALWQGGRVLGGVIREAVADRARRRRALAVSAPREEAA